MKSSESRITKKGKKEETKKRKNEKTKKKQSLSQEHVVLTIL